MTKIRKDVIFIEKFFVQHPELGDDTRASIETSNFVKGGQYSDSHDVTQADILTVDEIKAFIDAYDARSPISFWNTEQKGYKDFRIYLFENLSVDELVLLLGNKHLPFKRPLTHDPVENLINYLDFEIDLLNWGRAQANVGSSFTAWIPYGDACEQFFVTPGHHGATGPSHIYRFNPEPSLTGHDKTDPYNELFWTMIHNPLDQTAPEHSAYKTYILFSYAMNTALTEHPFNTIYSQASAEAQIRALEVARDIIRNGLPSLDAPGIQVIHFIDSPAVDAFVFGSLSNYLYEYSLARASSTYNTPSYQSAETQLITALRALNLPDVTSETTDNIVDCLLRKTRDIDHMGPFYDLLTSVLEKHGYSIKSVTARLDNLALVYICVPVRLTGNNIYSGIVASRGLTDHRTTSRPTYTPIVSQSLDLLHHFYDQGAVRFQSYEAAEVLALIAPGKKLKQDILTSPAHPLASLYRKLPVQSKKNWDNTWDKLSEDLLDYNRLVRFADDYEGWFSDPMVEQYHYALFNSLDPDAAFLMLLDFHRTSQGEVREDLNLALAPIVNNLIMESRVSSSILRSRRGHEEISVEVSTTRSSNAFTNLDQIPYEELAQRIDKSLYEENGDILTALRCAYNFDEDAFFLDGHIKRIDRYRDTTHLRDLERQGKLTLPENTTRNTNLPIKNLLRFRPRWTELQKEVAQADTDGDKELSLAEFLNATFSQPVSSFLKVRLVRHPFLVEALMDWESFEIHQKTNVSPSSSWERLGQKRKTGRAGLLESHQNLDLLPALALKKIILLATDQDLRLDAWTVYSHQYPDEGLALWKELFDLWEADTPHPNRNIDWVDIITPLKYLGGRFDPALEPYLDRLQTQMHNLELPDPDGILFNTLWTQSKEIVPWPLFAEVYNRIDTEVRTAPDYKPDGTATLPETDLRLISQTKWLQQVIFCIDNVLRLGAHITPQEMQTNLRDLDQIEDWQADLVVLALYGNESGMDTIAKTRLINQALDSALILSRTNLLEANKDAFMWLGTLAQHFTQQEISLTDFQITSLVGLYRALYYTLRNDPDISLFPLTKLLWQHRAHPAVATLFKEKLFEEPCAWIFQTLLYQLLFSENSGLSAGESVDQVCAELGLSYQQTAYLLTKATEFLLGGEGAETQMPLRALQERGLEAVGFCLSHIVFSDPKEVDTLINLYRKDKDDDPYDEVGLNAMALLILALSPQNFETFLEHIPQDIDPNDFSNSLWATQIMENVTLRLYNEEPQAEQDKLIARYLDHPLSGKQISWYLNPVSFYEYPSQTTIFVFSTLLPFFSDYVPVSDTATNRTGLEQTEVHGIGGYIDRYQDCSQNLPRLVRMLLLGLDEGVFTDQTLEDMVVTINVILERKNLPPLARSYLDLLLAITGDADCTDKMVKLYLSKTEQDALLSRLHPLEISPDQYQSYYSQKQSDFDYFLQQVGLFLAYTNPELLFSGNTLPALRYQKPGRSLVMVESGFVDTDVNGIGEVVLHDLGLTNAEPSPHATWVAQVIFGNKKEADQNEGPLHSYAIDLAADIWLQVGRVFEDILKLARKGEHIDAVNFSFGAILPLLSQGGYAALLKNPDFKHCQDILSELSDFGVVLVVAAGNSGEGAGGQFLGTALGLSNTIGLLGDNVVLTGSLEFDPAAPYHEQQKTAPYSARGGSVSGVDLLAAGSDYTFWTNKPCHLSQDIDGTSFSAPYTTRVIRMMRQINPQLKGETVIAILKASAEDLGTQLPEDQGAGRLVASRCFFLAWLMRPGIRGPKKADVLAKELCIEHELRELRWLARRIKSRQRHNVSVDQSYGVYEKI